MPTRISLQMQKLSLPSKHKCNLFHMYFLLRQQFFGKCACGSDNASSRLQASHHMKVQRDDQLALPGVLWCHSNLFIITTCC